MSQKIPDQGKQEVREIWLEELHRDHHRRMVRWRQHIFAVQLSMLVAMFLLWELAGRLRWIDVLLFSYPSKIFAQIGKDVVSGEIWAHVGVTVGETVVGFLLGTLVGTLLAVLIWWSPFCPKCSILIWLCSTACLRSRSVRFLSLCSGQDLQPL